MREHRDAGIQTDTQTCRNTDGHTYRHEDRRTCVQTNGQTYLLQFSQIKFNKKMFNKKEAARNLLLLGIHSSVVNHVAGFSC